MRDESCTVVVHHVRTIGRRLDIEYLASTITQYVISVGPDGNAMQEFLNFVQRLAFEHQSFERIMRHRKTRLRPAANIVGEMANSVSVDAVIADHATERPD